MGTGAHGLALMSDSSDEMVTTSWAPVGLLCKAEGPSITSGRDRRRAAAAAAQ